VGYAETLPSPRACAHGGASGTFNWFDPGYEVVGVYLSVCSFGGIPAGVRMPEWFGHSEMMGRADLLVNAVTAAVVDV
jgi:CubicO group peptidase (beta-lactamase class C family)